MRIHSGTVPNLRFSFEDAHPRVEDGGCKPGYGAPVEQPDDGQDDH